MTIYPLLLLLFVYGSTMDLILKYIGPLEKIFKDIVAAQIEYLLLSGFFQVLVHIFFTLNRISRIKKIVLKSENGTLMWE